MEELKKQLFSEHVMKIVNTLFCISFIITNPIIQFGTWGVWIVFLIYSIKNVKSRVMKVVYGILCMLAVMFILLGLYDLISHTFFT